MACILCILRKKLEFWTGNLPSVSIHIATSLRAGAALLRTIVHSFDVSETNGRANTGAEQSAESAGCEAKRPSLRVRHAGSVCKTEIILTYLIIHNVR